MLNLLRAAGIQIAGAFVGTFFVVFSHVSPQNMLEAWLTLVTLYVWVSAPVMAVTTGILYLYLKCKKS